MASESNQTYISQSMPELSLNKDTESPSRSIHDPPVHLIVSGGGGAFLHPTHVPSGETLSANGHKYIRASCYPSEKVSRYAILMIKYVLHLVVQHSIYFGNRRYALLNIFGFRRRNWRFDVVGGIGVSHKLYRSHLNCI